MSRADLAELELEVRQLDGVVLVTFSEDDERTLVEVTVEDGVPTAEVRSQTQRLAESQLAGPVVVTVLEDPPVTRTATPGLRLRVQLLAVAPLPGGQVEVHLAYRDQRAVSTCRSGDRIAVAGAVLDGLGKLGLRVPFEATSVHLISGDLGDGALVQLRHQRQSGTRRGLAGGRLEEEAIARAVLNGLNRYLEEGAVADRLGSDGLSGSAGLPNPGLPNPGLPNPGRSGGEHRLGDPRDNGGIAGGARARAGAAWQGAPIVVPI